MAFQANLSDIYNRFMNMDSSVKVIATGVLVGGLVLSSGVYLHNYDKRRKYQAKAENRAKRAKRNIDDLKRELNGLKINKQLSELSFEELQNGLQTGKFSATDVLRAFQSKALEVNERTNAITDIIQDASVLAAKLDSLPADQRGPLHGIPITVKETCGLKGEDCTAGFTMLVDVPMEHDSVLLQVLKSKGAIPFARTNCPQGMRSFGSDNSIYDVTVNPHNSKRGPGGSSSGEGALIGGGGSILGVGSDIGGSVRIPAAYSGCYSLRPTAGRLGYQGNFDPGTANAQNIVLSTDGPLGRDVASLIHFMKAVLTPDLWNLEPSVPPTPFDENIFTNKQPLRIGFYIDNGCTRPVPAVERAVHLAKSALQRLGHTLIQFDMKPYAFEGFSKILIPALVADDGAAYTDLLQFDRPSVSMLGFYQSAKEPAWMSYLHSLIMPYEPTITGSMTRKRFRSVDDWFKMIVHVQRFRERFIADMKKDNLDVILCPAMPCPANTLGVDIQCIHLATYTGIWNTLNFPAGVVPVTTVTSTDVANTKDPKHYEATKLLETTIQSDPKHYEATKLLETTIQSDADGSEGLPISVQIAGLPFKEEMVLRVMAQLEKEIPFQIA